MSLWVKFQCAQEKVSRWNRCSKGRRSKKEGCSYYDLQGLKSTDSTGDLPAPFLMHSEDRNEPHVNRAMHQRCCGASHNCSPNWCACQKHTTYFMMMYLGNTIWFGIYLIILVSSLTLVTASYCSALQNRFVWTQLKLSFKLLLLFFFFTVLLQQET